MQGGQEHDPGRPVSSSPLLPFDRSCAPLPSFIRGCAHTDRCLAVDIGPATQRLPALMEYHTIVIIVTGSTGTIGRELVRLLSERGQPVRAVLRDFTKARQLEHVAWIQADLVEKDKLDAVLAGTERLFLLTDNTPGFGRIQIEVIRAAERLGVHHVVKLSALGASGHSRAPLAREHWEVEQVLQL